MYHRVGGYFLITACFVEIALGILRWTVYRKMNAEWLAYANIGFFGMIGLLLEIKFRKMRGEEDPYATLNVSTIISEDEFEFRIKNGEKLVILDNLVLDVS
jgi:hypothetical protein